MARALPPAGDPRLRALLRERAAISGAAYAAAIGDDPGLHLVRVAAIDAGEPIELSGWELPPRWRSGFSPYDRVVVDRDGSVRRVGHRS